MTYLASTGDEQAQAGLLGIADQFGKFIRDPAGSIDEHTQKQLGIADQYRAAGDEESAKEVEFQLAFEYIGAFTGITSVTVSIPKNVIRSFSRKGTDIDVNISSSGHTSDIDTPVDGVSNTDIAGKAAVYDNIRKATKLFDNDGAKGLGLTSADIRVLVDVRSNSKWDDISVLNTELSRRASYFTEKGVKEIKIVTSNGVVTWKPEI